MHHSLCVSTFFYVRLDICLTHHGSESDQSNEGIRRQQAQADHQSLPQRLELILIHTGVDDIDKDGWDLRRSREGILDGRVLREELGGKVGCGDILVVRWEGVALETKRADPEFPSDVDLATIVSVDPTSSTDSSFTFILQNDTHQYGFRIALQLALHVTGSYSTGGRSSLSFNGVYRAEMGTTVRVASIRLDGHAFHEKRTPARSDTSPGIGMNDRKHKGMWGRCCVNLQPTIAVLHVLKVRAVHADGVTDAVLSHPYCKIYEARTIAVERHDWRTG